ncbi:phiSLT ORF71-like protein [Staphylococcus aureus]|nr:phiSLT ORF71-like protein [Staphylococcus aureus]SCS78140.1 phiSLT ORF71-like protein [Staphylococcus aureus]SCU42867.1 phiSLT ORF71-like protein [Staphylococcus aureus]
MDVKSEGLDISIPRISRSYHAPVESLTENERGLRKEILKSIKKVITAT